ncbi:MAG: hypothetical protein ACK5M0_01515 [Bacteroidales bacterium]
MGKVLFLVIFLVVGLSSKAQSLVSFNCDEAREINKSLIEKTPFILRSDSTDKEIGYIENTLSFVRDSDTIKCHYFGDATQCLDAVYKAKYENTNVYIVLFYEMLVGYNYCIIIKEESMEVFLTDIFNLNDELYNLDYESIDFIEKRIKATDINNPKNKKHIHFVEQSLYPKSKE